MPWGPSSATKSNSPSMESAFSTILRTPGLFIIDYWWHYERTKSFPKSFNRDNVLTACATNLALLNGFLLLLLPISWIRSIYTHMVCGALLISAHLLSYYYVNVTDGELDSDAVSAPELMVANVASRVTDDAGNATKQISLLAVHVVIAVSVSCLLRGPQKPLMSVLACYTLPVIARLADFPEDSLQV